MAPAPGTGCAGPAECDTTLHRDAKWFWNPDNAVKTPAELEDTYYASVGHNCQLLLNVPPDNHGRFDQQTLDALNTFGATIANTFDTDLAQGASARNETGTSNTSGNEPANVLDGSDGTAWQPTSTTGSLVLDLGSDKTFDVLSLQENIQVGQRVSSFAVDAWNGSSWQQIANATTIGYKRLLRLPSPVTTSQVRLRITGSRALPPAIATFGLYQRGGPDAATNLALGRPTSQSSTLNSSMGAAGRAVDGNTNGDFFAGSVTHPGRTPTTRIPGGNVDLGSSQQVGTVELWNRTDCCPDRLRQFYVFASATPFTSNDPQATAAQSGVWSSLKPRPPADH